MRIALLSDIHGNIDALRSVLDDVKQQNVNNYAVLGDLIFLGLYPRECYEEVMNLSPIALIKGNTDANIEDISSYVPTNSFEQYLFDLSSFTYTQLGKDAAQTISSWPIAITKIIEDKKFIFCHGSPYSFTEALLPKEETSSHIIQKLQEEDADIICAGHTHQRGTFYIKSKMVINPGAIGYTFDGTRGASYAIVDVNNDNIQVEIRTVNYNQDTYIDELEKRSREFPLLKSAIYALTHARGMPNFRESFTKE